MRFAGGLSCPGHARIPTESGAGIVGASITYHLARSGVSVTVIDKAGPTHKT